MNPIEIKLSGALEASFPSTTPPGFEEIRTGGTEEEIDVARFFSDRNWNELTLRELQDGYNGDISACLGFMQPKAFCYYLPLFLRICLVDYETADVTYTVTLWRLTPSHYGANQHDFEERFGAYSAEQNKLIAEILLYLSDVHKEDSDAGVALEQYWDQYLTVDE